MADELHRLEAERRALLTLLGRRHGPEAERHKRQLNSIQRRINKVLKKGKR